MRRGRAPRGPGSSPTRRRGGACSGGGRRRRARRAAPARRRPPAPRRPARAAPAGGTAGRRSSSAASTCRRPLARRSAQRRQVWCDVEVRSVPPGAMIPRQFNDGLRPIVARHFFDESRYIVSSGSMDCCAIREKFAARQRDGALSDLCDRRFRIGGGEVARSGRRRVARYGGRRQRGSPRRRRMSPARLRRDAAASGAQHVVHSQRPIMPEPTAAEKSTCAS